MGNGVFLLFGNLSCGQAAAALGLEDRVVTKTAVSMASAGDCPFHDSVEKEVLPAEDEGDLAKWNALTDAEKASVDALSGATISISDAHGDLLGAIEAAWAAARDSVIAVG